MQSYIRKSASLPDNYADGQLAERHAKGVEEDFAWDGLALIRRDKVDYTVEPHPNGGNAILARSTGSGQAGGKVMFNDILGSSLGSAEGCKFYTVKRTSFGEYLDSAK